MPKIIPLELYTPLGILPTGRLQLFSILRPFFQHVDAIGRTKKANATTLWQLRQMLKMWRTRVVELGEFGWEKAQRPNDLDFLTNCLPTACRVSRKGSKAGDRVSIQLRMCGRANVCPWCWARRASTCFERVEKILFPYVSTLRLAVEKLAVDGPESVPSLIESASKTLDERCERFDIVFMDRHRHLLFDDQLDEFEDAPERERRRTLPNWLKLLSRGRAKDFMKLYKPYGAVDFFTVSQDHGGGCSVHLRHLVIYPTGEIPDIVHNPVSAEGVTTDIVEKPTRGELISQMARLFRYPRFYMDGTPGRVADILNTLDRIKVRPLSQFGAVSGKQKIQLDDANS